MSPGRIDSSIGLTQGVGGRDRPSRRYARYPSLEQAATLVVEGSGRSATTTGFRDARRPGGGPSIMRGRPSFQQALVVTQSGPNSRFKPPRSHHSRSGSSRDSSDSHADSAERETRGRPDNPDRRVRSQLHRIQPSDQHRPRVMTTGSGGNGRPHRPRYDVVPPQSHQGTIPGVLSGPKWNEHTWKKPSATGTEATMAAWSIICRHKQAACSRETGTCCTSEKTCEHWDDRPTVVFFHDKVTKEDVLEHSGLFFAEGRYGDKKYYGPCYISCGVSPPCYTIRCTR